MTGYTDYTGSDKSIDCAYPGCERRLRYAPVGLRQFCSKEHRDGHSSNRITMEFSRGTRFGWYGTFTLYTHSDIIGIGPEYGWWRPTRKGAERAVKREIHKLQRRESVQRIEVPFNG